MPFEPGERVCARVQAGAGHTRLPAYLQGKPGVVTRLLGEYPFSDERAGGNVDAPGQLLYTVRFAATDVWPNASPGDAIAADLFESYLEGVR